MALLRVLPDAIVTIDSKFRIETWNLAAEERYGWGSEEVVGRLAADVLGTEYVDASGDEVLNELATTGRWRGQAIRTRRDGSRVKVETRLAKAEQSNGTSAIIAIDRAIDEERSAELLEDSEQWRELALASGEMGAWDLDLVNDTAVRNARHYQIFGYEELLPEWGAEIFMTHVLVEDRPAIQQAFDEAFETDTLRFESRITRRDGQERWIAAQGRVRRDESGAPARMLGTVMDITELKRAEEAVKQAQAEAERANHAKSEFLSRMSHELRTPLNAILGFAQLLEMEERDDANRESVHQILKGGRLLLELINEVLDIARIESGRLALSPESVGLRDLLSESVALVRPMADERGIALTIGPGPDLYARADRQRLKQIVLNLLSNAIKYNRDGGSVAARLVGQNDLARIEVQDTGSGIREEELHALFTPFERLAAAETDVEGTGLGLSLSKALIEAMGGRIHVESILGQGSTFAVELPSSESEEDRLEDARRQTAFSEVVTYGPRTVLCIEDNVSNLKLVERILVTRPGVALLTAMQGTIGIDFARQHHPDLIFLDLHLPDLPGKEALRLLQRDPRTADIPVVILSADATQQQIDLLLASGARDYLTKPFDINRFLSVLDEMLARDSEDPHSP